MVARMHTFRAKAIAFTLLVSIAFSAFAIGEPGKSWGPAEEKEWRVTRKKQRSYFEDTLPRVRHSVTTEATPLWSQNTEISRTTAMMRPVKRNPFPLCGPNPRVVQAQTQRLT